MKYIKNNGRYDFSFTLFEGSKRQKVTFVRERVYMDTGNIAVSGITPVEDDLFKELSTIKQFKAMLDKGTFEVVDPSKFAKKEDDKDREIKELKDKLAELNPAETERALADKDKEIASLKAQLEAKGKKGNVSKSENKGDETAGDETADDEAADDEAADDETANVETEGF